MEEKEAGSLKQYLTWKLQITICNLQISIWPPTWSHKCAGHSISCSVTQCPFFSLFSRKSLKLADETSVNIYCEIFLRKNTSPEVFFLPRISVRQKSFKCNKKSHQKMVKFRKNSKTGDHTPPHPIFLAASLNWPFLDNDLEPGFRMDRKYSQDMKRAFN